MTGVEGLLWGAVRWESNERGRWKTTARQELGHSPEPGGDDQPLD